MAFSCIMANVGTDATVPAGPEGDPGPRVGPVLLAWLEIAGGHEGVGVGEVLGDPVADGRAGRHEFAGGNPVVAVRQLLHGDTQQKNQWRVQPQRLLERDSRCGISRRAWKLTSEPSA